MGVDKRHHLISLVCLQGGSLVLFSLSVLLSSLELSDTKVYDSRIRARLGTAAHACQGRVSGATPFHQHSTSQFENSYFTEMCSGSEASSYFRLTDFVHHSALGQRVIRKKAPKSAHRVRRQMSICTWVLPHESIPIDQAPRAVPQPLALRWQPTPACPPCRNACVRGSEAKERQQVTSPWSERCERETTGYKPLERARRERDNRLRAYVAREREVGILVACTPQSTQSVTFFKAAGNCDRVCGFILTRTECKGGLLPCCANSSSCSLQGYLARKKHPPPRTLQ